MSAPIVHKKSLVEIYYPTEEQLMLEAALLKEGMIGDAMVDVLQLGLSTGAVAAFPGAGADTIVDALFAAKDSKNIFDAVEKMLGVDPLGQVILDAVKLDFAGNRKGFYKQVKTVAAKALAITKGKGRAAVKKAAKVVDDALKRVKRLIAKVARSVGKWVATVLPNDLGLGGPAFQAFIYGVVDKAAANAYDITVGGLDALDATKYLVDPSILGDMLTDLTNQMIELCEETMAKNNIEDVEKSLGDFASTGAGVAASGIKKYPELMLKNMEYEAQNMKRYLKNPKKALEDDGGLYNALFKNPMAAKKAIAKGTFSEEIEEFLTMLPNIKEWLVDFRDKVIPYIVMAVKKLISWLMAGLAVFQMLADPKERKRLLTDYDKLAKEKAEEREAKKKKLAAGYDPSTLRLMIREELTNQNARRAVHNVIMTESKSIIKRLAHREVLTECMNDLITEKMIVATVNDITAFKPEIRDWAEVLVDELEQRAERMKDMSDKRRESIINSLVSVAVKDLIKTTGGMTSPSAAKFKREEEEKRYQQMKRDRRRI